MWPFNREKRAAAENPSVPLSSPQAFEDIFGASGEVAGESVTWKTALEVPAIWSAVHFLSSTIASLPLNVYQRTNEGREKQEGELQAKLHDRPNREWTSYRWRKYSMQMVLVGGGRAYTWIQRNRAGGVLALWPLEPGSVMVERVAGELRYRYYPEDGPSRNFEARDVIDIPFLLEPDQVTHIDPVARLRQTIGLSLALNRYATRHFDNGGVPPMQLVGPMGSPAAAERASSDMLAALKSAAKKKLGILPVPKDHELKGLGANPEQSQLESARRFQIEEVSRIYNVPPVFLQDLTHGTFSNTEQQDLHFVKHTLTQWLRSWEQEFNLKLFPMQDRSRFVEFDVDGLLRGDFKTRMDGMSQAIQNSIMTPNEARAKENRPPKPGGDDLMIQQNMSSLNRLGDSDEDGTPE